MKLQMSDKLGYVIISLPGGSSSTHTKKKVDYANNPTNSFSKRSGVFRLSDDIDQFGFDEKKRQYKAVWNNLLSANTQSLNSNIPL